MTNYEILKDALNLKDVALAYGLDLKHGDTCPCCFHDEKTPSMKIYPDHYYCYGCGAGGDVTNLTAQLFGISKQDAMAKLSQDFGVQLDREYDVKTDFEHQKKLRDKRQWEKTEKNIYLLLSDKLWELKNNREKYAPKSENDYLHPLFVEALHSIPLYEEYCEFFITATEDDKKAFVQSNKSLLHELQVEHNAKAEEYATYTEVYARQCELMSHNPAEWQNFLRTAAMMYKYEFTDQVLIHSQYPNATAVAPIEFWNKNFSRFADEQSKGIALFDKRGREMLTYVFDVSNTTKTDTNAKEPYVWYYRPEHEDALKSHLQGRYSIAGGTLSDTVMEACKNIVDKYADENLEDEEFRTSLLYSVSYSVFSRLGLDHSKYFDEPANLFQNDKLSLTSLGISASILIKDILLEIDTPIKQYDRIKEKAEGIVKSTKPTPTKDVPPLPEMPKAKAVASKEKKRVAKTVIGEQLSLLPSIEEQIQDIEIEKSKAKIAPAKTLSQHGAKLEENEQTQLDYKVGDIVYLDNDGTQYLITQISDREVQTRNPAHAYPIFRAENKARFEDMLRNDERNFGNVVKPMQTTQAKLENSEKAPTTTTITETLSHSAVSLAEFDAILRDGANDHNSAFRIATFFSKDKGKTENAEFLRNEYLRGRFGRNDITTGKGFDFNRHSVCAWFDENGISLAIGTTARNNLHKVTITWDTAADRVQELMLAGKYISADDFKLALNNTFDELSTELLDFYRNESNVPDEWKSKGGGGYPEDRALVRAQLDNENLRQPILDRLEKYISSNNYEGNERRRYDSNRLLEKMRNALLPTVISPSGNDLPEKGFKYFITQDEVDHYLKRGGTYSEGKYRFLETYLNEKDEQKLVDFTKSQHGTGGGTWSATNGWSSTEPSKGLTISRGSLSAPQAEVKLSWSAVSKRIDKLIKTGDYLTQEEINYIPRYEKLVLARKVESFYYNLPPDEYASPFADDLEFLYPDETEWNAIRNFLGDYERVENTIKQMEDVVANMSDGDRFFDTRKKALEQLKAYQKGEYTLFPGLDLDKIIPQAGQTKRRDNGVFINSADVAEKEVKPIAAPQKPNRNIILQTVGDFYEATGFAAELVAKHLNLTLTSRETPNGGRVAMVGFPKHKLEQYSDTMLNTHGIKLVADEIVPSKVETTETLSHAGAKSENAIKEPTVTILISEHTELSKDTIMPFSKANALFAELDSKERNKDGYCKTYFKIEYEIDGETNTYEGRQDLGDGEGTLLNHIRNFYDFYSVKENQKRTNTMIDADTLSGISDMLTELEKHVKPSEKALDIDAVMQTALERVMSDTDFAQTLASAKNRTSLRNPCTWALEQSIRDHEKDEPAIFERYFKDIDFRDNLFDYVLNQSWENRPTTEKLLVNEKTPVADANFRITDNELGTGGLKEKFQANIAAIELLRELGENGVATPEQQETLSNYVGWGGMPQAFDEDNASWKSEYTQLRNLLSEEDYESARGSVLNAHYTAPEIISGMYSALEKFGFSGGRILEPSCGVGNFFGMLPDNMKNSSLHGVELDDISGKIAKHLYPAANIQIKGYEKSELSDNSFDVVIGNVPFGNYRVSDPKYNKYAFPIHDYFIAKSIDKLKPGGIMAVITTKGTMDKKNNSFRKHIAKKADLVGAIRLPNNAFSKNANTKVTSDILFFQKRERAIDITPDWVELSMTEDNIPVNSYFVDHPEMVLGNLEYTSGRFGQEVTCSPIEEKPLSEQLSAAVSLLDAQINTEIDSQELEVVNTNAEIYPPPETRNFSYAVVDDVVYYRDFETMKPVDKPAATLERIKSMVELRDTVRSLIAAQLDNEPQEVIEQLQTKMSAQYDKFSKRHGLISSKANKNAFIADSSYYLLCSLEVLDDERNFLRKADIFNKRTINAREPVESVETSMEALAVSIGEKAYVDLDFMGKLTGFSREKLLADLEGEIFLNVGMAGVQENSYVTADEYLSGNIRQKLELAKAAAHVAPNLEVNVKALEAVLPADLTPADITVQLGASWVNAKYIEQFAHEVFKTPYFDTALRRVDYSPVTGRWSVGSSRSRPNLSDIAASVTYGTKRMSAYEILDKTLNLQDVRVYDIDSDDNRILNKQETLLAEQKQAAIKQAFAEWIWKDPQRRQDLLRTYNDKFNSTVPRKYDGKNLIFHGMNPEIDLRTHQKNAIARVLYGGNTLLAHVVGAGKTFEMIAAAMEAKRLGLCQKSLVAVPNHLTQQWATEWLQLYPAANILVTTKKDFEPANRKKFTAKIAAGDYDAIIIGHSQFEMIPLSAERQERLLKEEIREISEAIAMSKDDKDRFSIKQMELTKKTLEAKLDRLLNSKTKDDVLTFEELGIDKLFVDESHNYKNLFTATKMRNIAGVSTSESQKATDMLMKCRYLDELTGNKGIVFASGTPVSNSLVELYTQQRYLQNDAIKQLGLSHFDAWAALFAEKVTSVELAPEGTGYRSRSRLAKFNNLPELMSIFKEVADIQTEDMLNLPVPKANYETIVAKPSELQKAMIEDLSIRAQEVNAGLVDASDDNMLCITNDGRKIGLDQRLIDPFAIDNPKSKVNMCVQNVYDIWQNGSADKLTQLVFCDFSTPKKIPIEKNEYGIWELDSQSVQDSFNVYDDMKVKLLNMGIPENEIAFIHDYNTDDAKKELFAKVRSGAVRVLFGSTAKMGAGTNVQDRLVAIHDLDAPWRPSDLQQRAGRIVRQGNMNEEVNIFRYVTDGSFDSYLYQTLEKKQAFISQIMTSKSPARSCDDIDDSTLSYAEIKALCAGSPLIKEQMDLDVEVAKLRVLRNEHQNQIYKLEDSVKTYLPKDIERTKQIIDGMKKDIEELKSYPLQGENKFSPMTINGRTYHDKMDAGKALLIYSNKSTPANIGEYRGFSFSFDYNQYADTWKMHLAGNGSYSVELGIDPLGNLTRINNYLAAMPNRLQEQQERLTRLETQLIDAKAELEKPFSQEAQYQEKSARLAAVTAELKLADFGADKTQNADKSAGEIANEKPARTVSSKSTKRGLIEKLNDKKEIANGQNQSSLTAKNIEKRR